MNGLVPIAAPRIPLLVTPGALRRPASPPSWATTASGQPGITAYLKNGGTLERQR
jgi:hypothetical protein